MGALMLRQERCLHCGGPMLADRRIDSRYCKPSCRTLAYRLRVRTQGHTKRSNRKPVWADGQPLVIGSALAGLADLQARILRLAHQLEQDDVAFRHPYPVDAADALQIVSQKEIPHPDATATENRMQELAASLEQAQADFAVMREQAAEYARQADALRGELVYAQSVASFTKQQAEDKARREDQARQALAEAQGQLAALLADQRTLASNEGRVEGLRIERDELRQQLIVEREQSATLRTQLTEASIQQAQWQAIEKSLRKQATTAENRARALETKLVKAQALAEALQQAAQANKPPQLPPAQLESVPVVTPTTPRTPLPGEANPLVRLMVDRVKTLHFLADYSAQRGIRPRGKLLDRFDDDTILKVAMSEAYLARQVFSLQEKTKRPIPRWVRENEELDPASERALLEEQAALLEKLKREMNQEKLATQRTKIGAR